MSTSETAARVAALQARATSYVVDRPFIARLWRTAARYVEVRVSRLSAFVTYYGFLALFPLAALAFAVFGILSRYLPKLDDAIVGSVTDNASTLGLSPEIVDQLQRAAVGLGLISLGFLLYAGVRWIESLREAIALVNGGAPPKGALGRRIAADLVLLGFFGVVFLGSVVLSTISTASATWLTGTLNLPSADGLVRIAAVAVSLLAGAVVLGLVMARLAGRPLRRTPLIQGAIVGAIGLEVLRLAAAYIIGRSMSNPVYGVFAVTIGLLVWINFTVKWVLVVATWVAVADDEGLGTQFLPGAAGGGDEPLSVSGVAAAPPGSEEGDDDTDDDQRATEPAHTRTAD